MPANSFRNTRWITQEPLRILVNSLEMSQFFSTDQNKEYDRDFKVGETIEVLRPQQWLIREGAAYSPQGITNRYSTVTMDQFFGVDWEYGSAEAVLNLSEADGEKWSKSNSPLFQSAMAKLANDIDRRCAQWAFYNANNVVGTLGTAVTTFLPYHRARQRLAEKACPPGEKGVIISPSMTTDIAANNLTLFNPSSEISQMFKEGSLGKAAGGDWYQSNNLYSATAGTIAGTNTVNGANQAGNTLTINATAGDTYFKGDRFDISAVNAVNPQNYLSTGTRQGLVVTQDLTCVGGGADVLQISAGNPMGIVGPGDQYQNVDALPTDGAALRMWPGTTSPNGQTGRLGFYLHRDAFMMVFGKLPVPQGSVEIASLSRDPKTGIALRFIRQYVGTTETWVNRWDVLMGFGNAWTDNCCCAIAGL